MFVSVLLALFEWNVDCHVQFNLYLSTCKTVIYAEMHGFYIQVYEKIGGIWDLKAMVV